MNQDPSATLFAGIRRRLSLWYAGALLVILLVFGIALYGVMRQTLLGPIQSDLKARASQIAAAWQSGPDGNCPPIEGPSLWACYDSSGQLIGASRTATFAPGFIQRPLAADAEHGGSAQDTVDAGEVFGTVERYATVVRDPVGHVIGVVVVGAEVGGELNALHVLLVLLIVLGVLTTLAAVLGGLFLADRALLPARLAYARQRDFIADASHELRTPLTMLRADAEVLLRGRDRLQPNDAALLEDVVHETSHMSSLASSMLDLARLDAGSMHVEQEVVDLGNVAESVAQRAAGLALERDVDVRSAREGPVVIIGDRLLVEQAALALVDNAIKYNHPGGEVAITSGQDGGWAYLEVRDTGIGIPAEHLPHLGERFYRVDKTRSRAIGGSGLGLSIARRIAARLDGDLQIVSEPEAGTTVRLRFPNARGSSAGPAGGPAIRQE